MIRSQCITSLLIIGKQESQSHRGDVMMEAEVREREREGERKTGRFYTADFEDGERGHKPRKADGFQKPEKTRKAILLSQKELALSTPRC